MCNFCQNQLNLETIAVIIASAVALITFVWTIYVRHIDHKNVLQNLNDALQNEILLNVESIFSNKPEKYLSFTNFDNLNKHMKDIHDISIFKRIQGLYNEMRYYQKFVEGFYFQRYYLEILSKKYDYCFDGENVAHQTVQRQIDLMNYILEFFDYKCEKPKLESNINNTRDAYIRIMNDNKQTWVDKIENEINEMFLL